ncbi:PspC domain-containing protein [Tenacibaculum finnmarkense]|uniref:PspC domain-containing protein n=1 Tax=Tenacibaculum finnmarkense genomovar finnmarkense TaxID=1458503 RepID=A0AAP1REN6_9FLAO|nr:PspC domain-containing protein [Tenacibaculum finnmarkense]MBE7652159.1 PspC domain-containing protein [Tenacibaculum finnmarkense genomovar finnmarkense]MBE7694669.1 PspC domain-containing protein [Tenacibaculum finnmarkense genomovar finnmarkense]MCD8426857.1 PspC domain-containing protein [Tenacibaculum finnmarkense genomovar finnmarkense]MCG8730643.1 PspC domain-containing protein [Tenacibaculum finnmarkense]MCG8752643.1 PspC domain-containing protein [Tenacibaculum finnmarkense]
MNKTININLGGFFFHIDEIAYQKLNYYLKAIANSLNDDPQGKNEIISDIEARISELLSEKITDVRQVINENDIEQIITIMGQPEDYSETQDTYSDDYSSNYKAEKGSVKKLFRDGDDKFLGGVCSGIAHYFNIDVIWIRLAFIILVASGFSPLAYIILWVLLPEAKTTSEKLQMQGEAVNIDTIEKKIRDEFEYLSEKLKDGANDISDKFSSADYEKIRSQTNSKLQDFIGIIGEILRALFKIFGKFIGILLIFIAASTILALLFGAFSIGSFEILNVDNDFVQYPPFFYEAMLPKWLLAISLFLLIGIPMMVLFILGLRILSPSVKKLNTTTVFILLGVWLLSLFSIGFSGIEYATTHAYNGANVNKHTINYTKEQPLKISVVNDDNMYYSHNLSNRNNAENVVVNDIKMKYSNDINIDVRKSETQVAYIEIKKTSEGKKRKQANDNAQAIQYNFKIVNNSIIFDAFFLSAYKNIWKDEEIKATVYIPENTIIYFEDSAGKFIDDIKNTQDIYDRDMANHHFKMTSKGFECSDCNSSNNDDGHNDRHDDKNEHTINEN